MSVRVMESVLVELRDYVGLRFISLIHMVVVGFPAWSNKMRHCEEHVMISNTRRRMFHSAERHSQFDNLWSDEIRSILLKA